MNKCKKELKELINLIKECTQVKEKKNGKFTGRYVPNYKEVYLSENSELVVLNHFGGNSHPIFANNRQAVDHYNIELHKRKSNKDKWKIDINIHVYKDKKILNR